MTTSGRDPRELSDPALDAAWRSASSEAPPPALDAAILAAAHRAVGAGPQRAAASAPWRWWTPLAAAAAIGAVAIGVLQLAPGDHDATPAAMSDAPRVATRTPSAADAKTQTPAAATQTAGTPNEATTAAAATANTKLQSPASEPAKPAKTAKNEAATPPAGTADVASSLKERAAPAAGGGATSSPAAPVVVGAIARPSTDVGGATDKVERDAPATLDAARKQKAVETKSIPDPFPGSKSMARAAPPPPAAAPASPPPAPLVAQPAPERQNATQDRRYAEQAAANAPAGRAGSDQALRTEAAQDLKKDAIAPAKPAGVATATSNAMAPAPAPPPAIVAQAQRPPPTGFAREPSTLQSASVARDSLGGVRSDNQTATQQAEATRSRSQAKGEVESKLAQGAAPAAAAPQAKVLADKARSPDDYIAAIRRFLVAGENEAARRELIAFRGAYTDADGKLPPELRAWAAAVPR